MLLAHEPAQRVARGHAVAGGVVEEADRLVAVGVHLLVAVHAAHDDDGVVRGAAVDGERGVADLEAGAVHGGHDPATLRKVDEALAGGEQGLVAGVGAADRAVGLLHLLGPEAEHGVGEVVDVDLRGRADGVVDHHHAGLGDEALRAEAEAVGEAALGGVHRGRVDALLDARGAEDRADRVRDRDRAAEGAAGPAGQGAGGCGRARRAGQRARAGDGGGGADGDGQAGDGRGRGRVGDLQGGGGGGAGLQGREPRLQVGGAADHVGQVVLQVGDRAALRGFVGLDGVDLALRRADAAGEGVDLALLGGVVVRLQRGQAVVVGPQAVDLALLGVVALLGGGDPGVQRRDRRVVGARIADAKDGDDDQGDDTEDAADESGPVDLPSGRARHGGNLHQVNERAAGGRCR